MSLLSRLGRRLLAPFGTIGRAWIVLFAKINTFLSHASGISRLFLLMLFFSFVAPFVGRSKLRKQLILMLSHVGVRSFPIVALVSLLICALISSARSSPPHQLPITSVFAHSASDQGLRCVTARISSRTPPITHSANSLIAPCPAARSRSPSRSSLVRTPAS